MYHRLVSLLCIALVSCMPHGGAEEAGFVPLFDGRSLEHWESPDMSYWSVEDEAITGTITPQHPCEINQYLVWRGGPVEDFELKLRFRMISYKPVNGGFQFRSRLLPGHDVAGYQVDNDTGAEWRVRLYDEHGRHDLALRGQKNVIAATGEFAITPLPEAQGAAEFRLDEWHEYHLICHKEHLQLKVNGKLVAEVVDNDPKQQEFSGILALQLHSGPPMKVQFRDIRLKKIGKE